VTDREAQQLRLAMVESQIARRGVRDQRVLEAMRFVPRHEFVPPDQAPYAYEDRALAVGEEQTISQPYIVGYMTELLRVAPEHRVLEIGTGTGYQTAVLSRLAHKVYTVERLEGLAATARERLTAMGYGNVEYRVGDGTLGWPEAAPFDRILVTAAAPSTVEPLVDQLREGGRLVVPVGGPEGQHVTVVERRGGRLVTETLIAVRFVKLIGAAGFPG